MGGPECLDYFFFCGGQVKRLNIQIFEEYMAFVDGDDLVLFVVMETALEVSSIEELPACLYTFIIKTYDVNLISHWFFPVWKIMKNIILPH